jgi:hypothetical protein
MASHHGLNGNGAMSDNPSTPPPPPMPMEQQMLMPPGARVLVAGSDGLLHAAMVRQVMQGYYEVEIGATGETVWVPVSQVVPEH